MLENAERGDKARLWRPTCDREVALERVRRRCARGFAQLDGFDVLDPTLLLFDWESHGNHTNSTSRVLKTARDRIGAGVALGGEETLLRAVQNCGRVSVRLEKIV